MGCIGHIPNALNNLTLSDPERDHVDILDALVSRLDSHKRFGVSKLKAEVRNDSLLFGKQVVEQATQVGEQLLDRANGGLNSLRTQNAIAKRSSDDAI